MTPGRIATLLAIVAGVAGAITPAAADLDWTSTAGVIAGTLAIVAAIAKWLTGWQQHERLQAVDPAFVADLDDTAGADDHPAPEPITPPL
jgi:hypothetical protein